MRDVEVLLAHRSRSARRPWRSSSARWTCPRRSSSVSRRSAATSRPTGRSGPRTAAPSATRTSTARRHRRARSSTTTSSRGSSTTGTRPACRSACTRSGTARSSRCSRAWESDLPPPRLSGASSLPRATTPDRALRDADRRADRARRDARDRGLDATDVRRSRGGSPASSYERAASAPERALDDEPVRTAPRARVVLGVGSDAPVVPWTPGATVHALEHHHDPDAATATRRRDPAPHAGSARLAHQEEKKGVLEPGMHADLAAYDVDPLAVDGRRRAPPRSSRCRWAARSGSPDGCGVLSHFLARLDLDRSPLRCATVRRCVAAPAVAPDPRG